jgi:hypothetical protein
MERTCRSELRPRRPPLMSNVRPQTLPIPHPSTMNTSSSHDLFVRVAVRALCLTVLCLASFVKAQPKPPEFSGQIDVRDVEPSALLYAVAEVVNINIVAPVTPSGQRVSFTTEFSSIDDFLQKLAKRVSMNGVLIGQRILVLSPCLHSQARNTPPRAPGQLSLRVPDATLKEFINLASAEESPMDEGPLLQRRLVARLVEVSDYDALQSAFVAFGGELVAGGRNPVDLAPLPANCAGVETAPATQQQLHSQALRQRANHCPYRTGERAKSCEPLEYFRLEQVTPRGYIEALGRRAAFVEAPDGLLHGVRRGAYIGQNFGKVFDVSRSGIELKEVVQDAQGVWQEAVSELRHWAPPGSPQSP